MIRVLLLTLCLSVCAQAFEVVAWFDPRSVAMHNYLRSNGMGALVWPPEIGGQEDCRYPTPDAGLLTFTNNDQVFLAAAPAAGAPNSRRTGK